MGLFGFGNKRNKTLDLTERYVKEKERLANLKENIASAKKENPDNQNASGLGFFANLSSSVQENNSLSSSSENSANSDTEERKKRFTKRIMDLTDKIEELSNQIYHLQQRIEVLERKNNLSI